MERWRRVLWLTGSAVQLFLSPCSAPPTKPPFFSTATTHKTNQGSTSHIKVNVDSGSSFPKLCLQWSFSEQRQQKQPSDQLWLHSPGLFENKTLRVKSSYFGGKNAARKWLQGANRFFIWIHFREFKIYAIWFQNVIFIMTNPLGSLILFDLILFIWKLQMLLNNAFYQLTAPPPELKTGIIKT